MQQHLFMMLQLLLDPDWDYAPIVTIIIYGSHVKRNFAQAVS